MLRRGRLALTSATMLLALTACTNGLVPWAPIGEPTATPTVATGSVECAPLATALTEELSRFAAPADIKVEIDSVACVEGAAHGHNRYEIAIAATTTTTADDLIALVETAAAPADDPEMGQVAPNPPSLQVQYGELQLRIRDVPRPLPPELAAVLSAAAEEEFADITFNVNLAGAEDYRDVHPDRRRLISQVQPPEQDPERIEAMSAAWTRVADIATEVNWNGEIRLRGEPGAHLPVRPGTGMPPDLPQFLAELEGFAADVPGDVSILPDRTGDGVRFSVLLDPAKAEKALLEPDQQAEMDRLTGVLESWGFDVDAWVAFPVR